LSIDIDGNDYWVWEAIKVITPIIIIIEYNTVFGIDRAVTIPYDPLFNRTKAHHSNLYYGVSLLSLCDLAKEKGYDFVGCNSSGNNAYFIRKDKKGDIRALSPKAGFVCSRFRESRDSAGRLSYIANKDRLEIIKGMRIYNTRENKFEVI